MVPANCSCAVSPVNSKSVLKFENIASEVARKKKSVFVVDFIIQFCIQVVEIELIVVDEFIRRKLKK